jgi:hypothetical protein
MSLTTPRLLWLVVSAVVLLTVLYGTFDFFSLEFVLSLTVCFYFQLLSPVDVVKTRIQLDPIKYNRGLIGGISQVVAEEGAIGLATGLGPTCVGYFIQGAPFRPLLSSFTLNPLFFNIRLVQIRWSRILQGPIR